MPLNTSAVLPIFRIFSIEKAREFYVGYLGFTVDWEHRYEENMPLYMQVSLGSLVLHLSEHYGDACPGSTIYVKSSGLEEFHREISAKNYGYLRPGLCREPEERSLELIDPFGNRIRLNEAL